jgi:hypothetical protein
VNQLSSPVTMVQNLFTAILSSNDSNSSHFWTLVARSCLVNWLGIHLKWKYFRWSESYKWFKIVVFDTLRISECK